MLVKHLTSQDNTLPLTTVPIGLMPGSSCEFRLQLVTRMQLAIYNTHHTWFVSLLCTQCSTYKATQPVIEIFQETTKTSDAEVRFLTFLLSEGLITEAAWDVRGARPEPTFKSLSFSLVGSSSSSTLASEYNQAYWLLCVRSWGMFSSALSLEKLTMSGMWYCRSMQNAKIRDLTGQQCFPSTVSICYQSQQDVPTRVLIFNRREVMAQPMSFEVNYPFFELEWQHSAMVERSKLCFATKKTQIANKCGKYSKSTSASQTRKCALRVQTNPD